MKKKLIIIFILFFSPLLSVEKEEVLNEKQKTSFLKKINWKKIKSSLHMKYELESTKMVDYHGCGEYFPGLPGQFPCSFLSDEFSPGGMEENMSMDASGGKIEIKISSNTNPLGGKVYFISDEENSGKNEFLVKAYFKKDRFISHYVFKKNLVIFKWEGKGSDKSLVSIYVLDLNEKEEPDNIRRISF